MTAKATRAQQREKVLALMQKPTKRSKYRAVRCEVDGEKFDSRREMRRWLELKSMAKAGEIYALSRQPSYPLYVGDVCLGEYRGDFIYLLRHNDTAIIEDCKGFRTPLYRWKKKHFEAQYGITILET